MRKKLDTRFPAARIKKIMQADEDVGKIALAVPVLVSKALELFLQDLCDRTYEVTLQRGAKTMSALHLKHCVQSYNVFDFLREIVSRVPDYSHGHGHADGAADHKTLQKRKPNGDECNDSDEESKRSRMQHDTSQPGGSTRGRGRGRRGRARGSRTVERETSYREVEFEPGTTHQQCAVSNTNPAMAEENGLESKESSKETAVVNDSANVPERNFDLNAAVNENEDAKAAAAAAAAAAAPAVSAPVPAPTPAVAEVTASGPAVAESSSATPTTEANQEEYPGWSLSEMDKMAIDPLQLAQLGTTMDEEEDYDEEG